ncbi:like COV 1 [Actinidia rufa]|uniref:Like COV 1 n=1 Tax=Actinidia rufa TaxID=165716 RepID=A0A7J0DRU4_9ERIC|nr:like COV 1 [Actinidia rufa]
MSSWLGASVLSLGEWFIKRMPFVRHIYSASKQISAAISPDQNTQAFKEVAIIRHPRIGEYAFGFITSSVVLQGYSGEEDLCCVYVPTNHLYIGDVFLVNSMDIIRPNMSVREGIVILSPIPFCPTIPMHSQLHDCWESQDKIVQLEVHSDTGREFS